MANLERISSQREDYVNEITLSPFIFILCTEALVSLINHAESQGKITGMRVSRANPPISHLLFADDIYLKYFTDKKMIQLTISTPLGLSHFGERKIETHKIPNKNSIYILLCIIAAPLVVSRQVSH